MNILIPKFPAELNLDPRMRFIGYDGPAVLNLGAGINPIIGAVNHDIKGGEDYVQFDVTQATWPFPENTFDKVLAFHIIEHIELNQVNKFLQQIHRVLKPSGALIIECPDHLKMCQEIVDGNLGMIRNMFSYARQPGDMHRWGYDASMLVALTGANGFGQCVTKHGTDYHSHQMPTVRIETVKV